MFPSIQVLGYLQSLKPSLVYFVRSISGHSKWCMCCILFDIPLHAARRATAAARLPKQRWRAFRGISISRPRPAPIRAIAEPSRHGVAP